MQAGTSFTESDVVGLLSGLADFIARETAVGNSVKIDGIGTFSAKLQLKKKVSSETAEEKRNAQSIEVGNVNFRADRKLIGMTNLHCRPKRKQRTYAPPLISLAENRYATALAEIEATGYLTIQRYAILTGLHPEKARRELKAWKEAGQLSTRGNRTYLLYVKKE